MKNSYLFILFFAISFLGIFTTSCTSNKYFPNHIGVSPSMEWEVQDGAKTKLKPKVGTSVDWNF